MYLKKMRLVVLLAIFVILISGAKAADNIPGHPENLAYTTDMEHFWINYTWSAGANTDSFNISVNGVWTNGTEDSFINIKSSPHGWANISVAGYNAISQKLSNFEYKSTQVPNNPITLTNVQSSYYLYEGQTLYIDANYTDADGDTGTFETTATKGSFDSSTGILSWKTGGGDRGVYNWQVSVTDGYGSVSEWRFTVIVTPNTGRPKLAYTTSDFWVNYTWSPFQDADSYNVSINGNWDNGSTELFKNTMGLPHNWVNISVAGYNAISQSIVPDTGPVYMNTQVSNNPITLRNISDRYLLNEGETLYISPGYTDADGDTGVFATNAVCVTNAKCTFNTSTGVLSWATGPEDGGIYNWYINVTDRYGSISTQKFKVIIPLYFSIKFTEPSIVNGKEQWIDSRIGHIGKLIAANAIFKNTGEDPLVLTVTEIHNNTRTKLPQVTLVKGQPFSYRVESEINSTEVNDSLFNYTFETEAMGSNGHEFTFRYSNTTAISLPIIPIYKIKRVDADIVIVSRGRNTPVTYILEANSSINLTNVSIYDPLYPDKYFNISKLEANKPSSINYTYQATTNDLSSKNCDEPYSCIINLATFTGKIESSGELIKETDYVEVLVDSIASTTDSSRSSGGGGGGGGIPPSEDYNNIEHRETWEMDILAGSASVYTFKASDPVMVVSFESSTSENEIAVAVEILKNRSKHVDADVPGKLYKYFNIYVGTSGFSRKVSKGVVAYRVNNSWLEENDLEPEDISLYKWEGGWVEKDTEIVEKKPNQTYYASLVGNFSSFAIAGNKKPKAVTEIINTSNESNATRISTDTNPSKLTIDLNLVMWIIAIIGVVSALYYFKSIKKPPK